MSALSKLPQVNLNFMGGIVKTGAWFQQYNLGGVAIELYSESNGYIEPWTTATKWVEGLAKDEVAIKDGGENEGVLNGLVEAGIIAKPHRQYHGDYGYKLEICKLLADPTNPDIEEFEE